jgi:DnaJ-class molecular chaperone
MNVLEAAQVLDIPGRASLNDIHTRFRELAKEWHPDVSRHNRKFPTPDSSASGKHMKSWLTIA